MEKKEKFTTAQIQELREIMAERVASIKNNPNAFRAIIKDKMDNFYDEKVRQEVSNRWAELLQQKDV